MQKEQLNKKTQKQKKGKNMSNNNKGKDFFSGIIMPAIIAITLVSLVSICIYRESALKHSREMTKKRSANDHVAENALVIVVDGQKKIILNVPAFDQEVSFKRNELPEIDFIFYDNKGGHQRVKPTLRTEKFYLYDMPSDVEKCARYSIQLIRNDIIDELFIDAQYRRNTIGNPKEPDVDAEKAARIKNCLTVLDLTGKP
jgi:hypothetical protein